MKLILIDIFRLLAAWGYLNIIMICLCRLYPNTIPQFIHKYLFYGKVFAITILITISWLAQFGSVGKYIIWTYDDKEYKIILPSLFNNDDGDLH